MIAGAVFLKTPSIFHRFMAEQREALRPLKIDNWRDVQRQFEKINLHRRQRGEQMYTSAVIGRARRFITAILYLRKKFMAQQQCQQIPRY
ncbi:conjugal transfer nickase/helicase domain-containing protein [Klebsiella pneumoniae]